MKRLLPCLLLAAVLPLAAQFSLDSKNRSGEPILINSDAMNVDLEKGSATFYGNVVVNDPDVIIECKKMVLYQEPKNKNNDDVKRKAERERKRKLAQTMSKEELEKLAKQEQEKKKKEKEQKDKDPFSGENSKLERIECIGDVKITRKNTDGKNESGTCGKAVYFHKEGSITMTIDPVLYQDDSKITGVRLTFFHKSKQIEGTDVKITAITQTDDEDSKKSDKKKEAKKKTEKSDAEKVSEFYSKDKKQNEDDADGENDSASSKQQKDESGNKKKLTQKEADALLGLDKVSEK